MTLTPIENIAAVYCTGKRAYPTLEAAERVAASHYACRACVDGASRLRAYVCQADPSHSHCGHIGVGQR